MKDSCLKPWGFPSNMWKYTWPHYLCVKINVGHLPRLQSSEMQPANQLNQPSNLYFNTLPKPPTHAIVMDISTRFPSPPPQKKRQKKWKWPECQHSLRPEESGLSPCGSSWGSAKACPWPLRAWHHWYHDGPTPFLESSCYMGIKEGIKKLRFK